MCVGEIFEITEPERYRLDVSRASFAPTNYTELGFVYHIISAQLPEFFHDS